MLSDHQVRAQRRTAVYSSRDHDDAALTAWIIWDVQVFLGLVLGINVPFANSSLLTHTWLMTACYNHVILLITNKLFRAAVRRVITFQRLSKSQEDPPLTPSPLSVALLPHFGPR